MDLQDTEGHSKESPIVISSCTTAEGIRQEYEVLAKRYGRRGYDWELDFQAVSNYGARHYDVMCIKLANGERLMVWFDITAFYGR